MRSPTTITPSWPRLPEFYADLEDQLGFDVPSFLRMGSWIGGDRDGNPNVTAEVTRETLAMQSRRALRHHLEELHLLGAELPLYGPMVQVSDALQALADRSPDTADERKDEPYRRALTGMYARLAATAWSLDRLEAPHRPVGPAPAYETADEFKADLDTIRDSLGADNLGPLARGRLRALRRAVDVFGFHLAELDIRQNSDVHERVMAELVEAAGAGKDYAALDEAARVALLTAEIANPRALATPHNAYGEETAGELDLLRVAADAHRRYGAASLPHYVISKADSVSDILEVARAAEGGRAAAAARGPARCRHRAAVRDDRRPAALRRDHGVAVLRAGLPPAARLARQHPGSDAGLLRQQQGRRLSHLDLGALQGRAGADRRVSPPSDRAAPVPRPRRLGRPRRRAELRRDPGAAARRAAGRDPRHRAGRGDRRQVFQPGRRPAQPRDHRGGDARSDPARGRTAVAAQGLPRRDGAALGRRVPRLSRAGLRDRGLRHLLPRIDGAGGDREPQYRQPAGVAFKAAAASRTCGRSPGCSAGRSAA